jgi:putative FmdB family regulatory protein
MTAKTAYTIAVMPLYDYKCADCKQIVEVRHGFNEAYDGVCPACGGKLNRVFNPAPIVFKGSGFYVNDSRGRSGEAKAPSDTKSEPKTESKAEPKTEAKTEGQGTSPPTKGSSDSAA